MNETSLHIKRYYHNLTGLRFIAFIFVFVHHLEQIKNTFGIDNSFDSNKFIQMSGKIGVVFFFTLSGFLITSILLDELNEHGKISITKFYKRRSLRIFPLYFLTIILGLIIIPKVNFIHIFSAMEPSGPPENIFEILLYFILLPNVALVVYGARPLLSQTWSIGTEEQYYLFWPIILNKFSNMLKSTMISIILFYICIKGLLIVFVKSTIFIHFWLLFPIDCMAIGAMASILMKENYHNLKYFVTTTSFITIVIILCVSLMFAFKPPVIYYEYYSFLFALLILNLVINKKIRYLFENPIFNFLGTISYGLYMFHSLSIYVVILILKSNFHENDLILAALSLSFTIIISTFSYYFYEIKFINKR